MPAATAAVATIATTATPATTTSLVRNELHLGRIDDVQHGQMYLCRAGNSNMSRALDLIVQLNVLSECRHPNLFRNCFNFFILFHFYLFFRNTQPVPNRSKFANNCSRKSFTTKATASVGHPIDTIKHYIRSSFSIIIWPRLVTRTRSNNNNNSSYNIDNNKHHHHHQARSKCFAFAPATSPSFCVR